jgi:hypothetical protein
MRVNDWSVFTLERELTRSSLYERNRMNTLELLFEHVPTSLEQWGISGCRAIAFYNGISSHI